MYLSCFGVIQNNIALKLLFKIIATDLCFGVIQNNIALKLRKNAIPFNICFGVIQNNIALKLAYAVRVALASFGVIQNNIALKPQMQNATLIFRNRATNSSKIFVFYDSEELFKYSR